MLLLEKVLEQHEGTDSQVSANIFDGMIRVWVMEMNANKGWG